MRWIPAASEVAILPLAAYGGAMQGLLHVAIRCYKHMFPNLCSITMSWDVLQLNINKSSMVSITQFGEWYLPLELIDSVSKLFDILAPNTE